MTSPFDHPLGFDEAFVMNVAVLESKVSFCSIQFGTNVL